MRRAAAAEIGGNPAPAPTGDLGAQLARMMSGLSDIADIKESYKQITAEHAALTKQVGQLIQYQKDHDELHRNMAAEHGKKTAELEKVVAQAITASQQDLRAGVTMQSGQLQEALESQRQHMMAILAVIQEAMKEFSGKEIALNVNVPEQNIQLEQPAPVLLDYKLIRGANNLLDRVREEHQK